MAKIAEAFVEITATTDKLQRGMRGAVSQVRQTAAEMARIATRMAATIGGLTAGVLIATGKAFAEQERAEAKLRGTLRAFGDEVVQNTAFLKDHASALQRTVGINDEATLGFFAQIRALGVQSQQIPAVARAAIGLASALGISNDAAARYVALATQGETTMLQRYIPALRTAKSEQEKLNLVLQFGERGFAAAQEEAKGLAGSFTGLRHAIGDVAESIGEVIFGGGGIQTALQQMSLLLQAFAKTVSDTAALIRDIFLTTWDIIGTGLQQMIAGIRVVFLSLVDFVATNVVAPMVNQITKLLAAAGVGVAGQVAFSGVSTGLAGAVGALPGQGTAEASALLVELKNLQDEQNRNLGRLFGNIGTLGVAFPSLFRDAQEQQKKQLEFQRPTLNLPSVDASAIKAIVSEVQTATGSFKTGQPVEEKIRDNTKDTVDELKRHTELLKRVDKSLDSFFDGVLE